ncbi:phage Gp37/Gp68 family protein [Nonomuraea basaltis]|nr:phage Gp37/Gp68 family protein [Nonomuraea basaltis]
MSSATSIEWTEVTWNPTTGCDQISPGCDNCYALTLAKRLKAMGQAKYQRDGDPRTSGPGFGVSVHENALTEPLRWRKPRKVFVNSMSDVGHARVPTAFVARIFATMALAPRHQFQLLTKRPRRLRHMLNSQEFVDAVWAEMERLSADDAVPLARRARETVRQRVANCNTLSPWPLRNVWIGTSIESDEYCWRAEEIRLLPAAVRFLSLEPLLGPLPSLNLTGIDWVIVGGESGPNHRPLDLDWVRDIRDRCGRSSTALFFKQVGGRTPKIGGRLLDGQTWDEFPHEVRPA